MPKKLLGLFKRVTATFCNCYFPEYKTISVITRFVVADTKSNSY